MWAVTWGHISVVKLLIKYKADIHRTDVAGMNALMHAVINENINIVEELIEHGAHLLKKNKHNATALTIARNTGNSFIFIVNALTLNLL
jgi:ankyrin repeat protein